MHNVLWQDADGFEIEDGCWWGMLMDDQIIWTEANERKNEQYLNQMG